MAAHSIGVDLGGTKINSVLLDPEGNQEAENRRETNVEGGPEAVEEQIREMIDDLTDAAGDGSVGSVGIGVAGQVEYDTGLVRGAPNLNWKNYPLKENLSRAIDYPVLIDNDVRMATYGEWRHGAGKGVDDIICIFVGTGVGGGIVSDGRLLRGYANTAGEIGHMTVDRDGPSCRCGNFGCVEAYAGGWAIAQRAREVLKRDASIGSTILDRVSGDINIVTAEVVADAAGDGDPLANRLMREASEALVAGCSSLINCLNPQRMIFGGGVIEGYPLLLEQIEQGVHQRALPAALAGLQLCRVELGDNAGVFGAAHAARDFLTERDDNND